MEQNKPFPMLIVGICLLTGGLMLQLPCVLGLLRVMTYITQHSGVGIIGGADGPTAVFQFRCMLSTPVFWICAAGGIIGSLAAEAGVFMTFAGILERLGQKNGTQL